MTEKSYKIQALVDAFLHFSPEELDEIHDVLIGQNTGEMFKLLADALDFAHGRKAREAERC